MALGIPSHKVSQTMHLKDAIAEGKFRLVKDLLESQDWHLLTLNSSLILACSVGHLGITELLLEHGAYVTTSNNKPIIYAAKNGRVEIAKFLIEKGGDCTDKHNCAIRKAAENGHIEVVKLLLENGADCTDSNNEAIVLASKNGHTEIVKLLIKNGANPDADNQRAISLAIENGHLDTVRALIEATNSFSIVTHKKSINIAARNGDTEIIKFFLDKIPDVYLLLLFSSICESGNLELVKYLLEHIEKRLDKNTNNIFQLNSLQRAVSYGHLDVVKFLLETDYDFSNELDEALGYAAENGYLEIMTLLTEKGANCNATFGPHKSLNAIKLASENNHLEAVEFLINHGAAKTPKQKVNLIEIAAKRGYVDIVEFLLNSVKKVNLNMAIKYATQNGHIEISKLLIRHTLIHTSKDFDAQIEMITKLTHDILNKR